MLNDETLHRMVRLLTREERKKLFTILCEKLKLYGFKSKPRLAEELARLLAINKKNVYRYLNGKIVPNPQTTAKVAKALIKYAELKTLLKILEPTARAMLRDAQRFLNWKKDLERKGLIVEE